MLQGMGKQIKEKIFRSSLQIKERLLEEGKRLFCNGIKQVGLVYYRERKAVIRVMQL